MSECVLAGEENISREVFDFLFLDVFPINDVELAYSKVYEVYN